MSSTNQQPWQLEVYKFSFKKKDKLRHMQPFFTKLKNNDRVLDVGCGNGVLSYLLQDRVEELHCVETNADRLRETQTIVPKAQCHCLSSEDLPFSKNYFDVVFLLDVLYYTDEKKTIAEIKRILKPGGTLIITVPFSLPTLSLRRFKAMLRVDPMHEGGRRESYDLALLRQLFGEGWFFVSVQFYSIFFIELLETVLVVLRNRREISSQTSVAERDIVSTSSFVWYKRVYWLLSPCFLVDNVLRMIGCKGHNIIVCLRKSENVV